mgnify:CR=1 FL=1|tara:strand:+ start:1958 stop:2173 length:216 start_codon:yes stop_codon:yes gene_type:complete
MKQSTIKVIGVNADGTEKPRGTFSWNITPIQFKCIDKLHRSGASVVVIEFHDDGSTNIYAEQEQPINLFSI